MRQKWHAYNNGHAPNVHAFPLSKKKVLGDILRNKNKLLDIQKRNFSFKHFSHCGVPKMFYNSALFQKGWAMPCSAIIHQIPINNCVELACSWRQSYTQPPIAQRRFGYMSRRTGTTFTASQKNITINTFADSQCLCCVFLSPLSPFIHAFFSNQTQKILLQQISHTPFQEKKITKISPCW